MFPESKAIETKYFYLGCIITLAAVFLQSDYRFDFWMQNLFFHATTKKWLIQDVTDNFKFTFYTLPKVLIGIAALIGLFFTWINRSLFKINVLAFLFCMVFIPSFISILKSTTNIHCPYDLQDFNGNMPFRHLFNFKNYFLFLRTYGHGNCFPGGHASGGYACMSFVFLVSQKYRSRCVLVGLLLGTYMGLYQMLRGAHFFSHILFTLGFSVITISFVSMLINIPGSFFRTKEI